MRKWLASIDWGSIVGSALLLVFLLAVSGALTNQQKDDGAKAYQESENQVDSDLPLSGIIGFIDRNRDDINATSTLAIAALTLALVVVGYVQARQLRGTVDKMDEVASGQTADMARSIAQAVRAAEAMERVANAMGIQAGTTAELLRNQREFWKRQMRAYVFLETGAIYNVADPPEGFQQAPGDSPPAGRLIYRNRGPIAQIRIRNSGHTPAHQVIHTANIVLREFPLTTELPELRTGDDAYRTVFDIAPLGGIATKALIYPAPLTAEEIAALREGRSAIYVYGEISYRDAFGDAHTTRYRSRHNELSGAVGASTELTGTNEGNNSD